MAMLASMPSEYANREAELPKMTINELRLLQRAVAAVHVHEKVRGYVVDLVEATRNHESIALGVSPRGMLVWQRVAQAWAFLHGRDFVTPSDVQEVALPTLSVRLVVRSGNANAMIATLLRDVPVPDYR